MVARMNGAEETGPIRGALHDVRLLIPSIKISDELHLLRFGVDVSEINRNECVFSRISIH